MPARVGDVGVRAFGLILSPLRQRTACGNHFLNRPVQLAPVGQTKPEMVDVAWSTRCVRALLKALWCHGWREGSERPCPAVQKQLLQAEDALAEGLGAVDIGDQELEVREALRFDHGTPRTLFCALARYSLKPCLPVIFT